MNSLTFRGAVFSFALSTSPVAPITLEPVGGATVGSNGGSGRKLRSNRPRRRYKPVVTGVDTAPGVGGRSHQLLLLLARWPMTTNTSSNTMIGGASRLSGNSEAA